MAKITIILRPRLEFGLRMDRSESRTSTVEWLSSPTVCSV